MSRVNHNSNYIYDTDGETVWEKLRVIRNFLADRRMAFEMNTLINEEKEQEMQGKEGSFEYRKWQIEKKQSDSLLQDCANEIKFLEEFESWLTQEAEKSRIPGKSDDEMYEINHFEELKLRLVKRAQAQLISCGHIESETLQRLLKNREALKLAVSANILSNEILSVAEALPGVEKRFDRLEYIPKESNE